MCEILLTKQIQGVSTISTQLWFQFLTENQKSQQLKSISWVLFPCFRISYSVLEHQKIVKKLLENFLIKGAGAKCNHFKLELRTRVRAHLNLDVQGACVRPKKPSQLTLCYLYVIHRKRKKFGRQVKDFR